MDREAFIETQAAFQLGKLEAEPGADLAELARAESRPRINLILHDPSDRSFVPADRGRELAVAADNQWKEVLGTRHESKPALVARALRNSRFLSSAYAHGLKTRVLVDMQDAVRLPNLFPTFQYNRRAGAENAVLWPHHRVHKLGAAEFCSAPDPDEPAFKDKEPVVFWRGSLRGFSRHGGGFMNIRSVIRGFQEGTIDRETLLAHLCTVPRYAFVARYFGEPGFDVGFKQPPELGNYLSIPEIARYETDFAPPERQKKARYLMSIQGTDVGSSFGWQVSTNSVLLKEEYGWQVFFDGHFRPGEDFMAVAPDFLDVREKVAWCEENPETCAAMIEKRHAAVRLLLEPDLRREALRRVIARYTEFYDHWAGSVGGIVPSA